MKFQIMIFESIKATTATKFFQWKRGNLIDWYKRVPMIEMIYP